MNKLAIRARGLHKTFNMGKKRIDAVRDVTFDVAAGELVALLGPNGAGKSTTLRMLTTLLPPTAGSAQIAGHDVVQAPSRVRRAIGYVGQRPASGEDHRIRDELITQGRCYGLGGRLAARRANQVLESLGIADLANRHPGTLSGGQRCRVDIALGLIHRPAVLFLDEPSTGLDPTSRAGLWDQIQLLRREYGITIVLTTHYLDEADQMADRIVIVDRGRVIADGTADALKADLAGDWMCITTPDDDTAHAAVRIAGDLSQATEVSSNDCTVRIRIRDAEAALPPYLKLLDAHALKVSRASVRRPALDDVFRALTGRHLDDSDLETPTSAQIGADHA